MEQPNIDQDLADAITDLYSTFADYELLHRVEGCPHCVKGEDIDRLAAKPLRELNDEDVSLYAFKAITTWGTEKDFKHFLPRLLELVANAHVIVSEIQFEVLFGKLDYAKWRAWPQREQQAVDEYILCLWRFVLDMPSGCPGIETYLCAIGQAVDDLAQYLEIWQQTVTPFAISHFLYFLDEDAEALQYGRLGNAFWGQRRRQMLQVVSWAHDPATTDRCKQNFADCIDNVLAKR